MNTFKCKECGYVTEACIITFDITNIMRDHERLHLVECDGCHIFTIASWIDAWSTSGEEWVYPPTVYSKEEAEIIFMLFIACRHYKDCNCEIHKAIEKWIWPGESIFERKDLIERIYKNPEYPEWKEEWERIMSLSGN